MRRLILTVAIMTLVCLTPVLILGCANRQTAGSGAATQSSPSPTTWVKYVSIGGSLNGWNRGRSSVDVETSGGSLRFLVTVGPAPGWGADVSKFRYWLWPDTTSQVAPEQVPLHVAAKTHETEQDSTTYDLRTTEPLMPGTYHLLYNGEGWYQMTVYVNGKP